MGQGIVVGDAHAYFRGEALGQPAEEFFVARFARSQRDQLQIVLHEGVGHLGNQIKALLGREAGDDAHQRFFPRTARQPELFQQILFAKTFSFEVGGRVGGGQVRGRSAGSTRCSRRR